MPQSTAPESLAATEHYVPNTSWNRATSSRSAPLSPSNSVGLHSRGDDPSSGARRQVRVSRGYDGPDEPIFHLFSGRTKPFRNDRPAFLTAPVREMGLFSRILFRKSPDSPWSGASCRPIQKNFVGDRSANGVAAIGRKKRVSVSPPSSASHHGTDVRLPDAGPEQLRTARNDSCHGPLSRLAPRTLSRSNFASLGSRPFCGSSRSAR